MTKKKQPAASPKDNQQGPSSEKDTDLVRQGDFSKAPLSDKIGKSLRTIYEEVANEPVPDAFLELLAKADENKSK